jgi:hypothetical protein
MSIGFISSPIASESTSSQFMISDTRRVCASSILSRSPNLFFGPTMSCRPSRMMRLTQPLTTQRASWPQRNRPLLRRPSSAAIWRKATAPRVERALFQLSDFARRTVNHIQKIEAEFWAARDDLSRARSDLDLARCRIRGIESSKFTAASGSVSSALHLPGWDRE